MSDNELAPGAEDGRDHGDLPPQHEIDAASLKGFAHPLRVRIWEWLSVNGEATASMLARELGESSGATSYHLRQLSRFGFVVEVEDQPTARERWWRIYPGGWRMEGYDFMRRPDTRMAATFVIGTLQRRREERFRRWNELAESLDPRVERWRDSGGDSTAYLRLTPAEAAELKRELDEVDKRWSRRVFQRTEESHPGTEMVEVQINVFPNLLPVGGESATAEERGTARAG